MNGMRVGIEYDEVEGVHSRLFIVLCRFGLIHSFL